MQPDVIDPYEVYRRAVDVLKNGLRTSTYKLATMTALIDFSTEHHPVNASSKLIVPLAELAKQVMALYWHQLEPFDGVELRQSTQPQSRIFEAIMSLRETVNPADDVTLEIAAREAPGIFWRAVDNVGVCLAQQPLPRLQRPVDAARSIQFMYDDSFLHDKVTRAELARHRNAIQLNPGVAHGLAMYADHLRQLIQSMWIGDVLRINKLGADKGPRIEAHLFGKTRDRVSPATTRMAAVRESAASQSGLPGTKTAGSLTFATRLNRLFDAAAPPYSSGEVAAKIRKMGFPMTVSTLTQLRAGVGPSPSEQTITALAKYFGVAPSYFLGHQGNAKAETRPALHRLADADADSDADHDSAGTTKIPVQAKSAVPVPPEASIEPAAHSAELLPGDVDIWGRVFSDDLDDIAAACEIRPNGCWIRPSNTPVRCRAPADARKPVDLPKLGLHRWAWMVANGYSKIAIPSYLIHIRRTCDGWTCCNPQHLFATSARGAPLSKTAIDTVLRRLPGYSIDSERAQVFTKGGVGRPGRLVLQANLASIRNQCELDKSGCWVSSNTGPLACRAEGDGRPDNDLPMMSPHRWVWMVVHGRSSNPLPADFHVRRRCGNDKCCRPDHLYLTTRQGEELTPQQADAILRTRIPHSPQDAGPNSDVQYQKPNRETASPSDATRGRDANVLASRLNKLFGTAANAEGKHYTSAEVAAALQEDGLPVSEKLIERLRSGAIDSPSNQIIEALSYFFNVDRDYFSAATQSTEVSDAEAGDLARREEAEAATRPPTLTTRVIDISIADAGQIVAGLSEAISACLESDPPRTRAARRLLPMLGHMGAMLTVNENEIVLELPVLQRLIEEWDSVTQNSDHQSIIAQLSRLADGD